MHRPQQLVRLTLAIWTGVLLVLIGLMTSSVPPSIRVATLPYLVLVGWALANWDRKPVPEPERLSKNSMKFIEEPPSDLLASAPLSASLEPSTLAETSSQPVVSVRSNLPPSPVVPARPRRRVRSKVIAEPVAASWVQVGPGRFVRDEEVEPLIEIASPERTLDKPLEFLSVAVGPTNGPNPISEPNSILSGTEKTVDASQPEGA